MSAEGTRAAGSGPAEPRRPRRCRSAHGGVPLPGCAGGPLAERCTVFLPPAARDRVLSSCPLSVPAAVCRASRFPRRRDTSCVSEVQLSLGNRHSEPTALGAGSPLNCGALMGEQRKLSEHRPGPDFRIRLEAVLGESCYSLRSFKRVTQTTNIPYPAERLLALIQPTRIRRIAPTAAGLTASHLLVGCTSSRSTQATLLPSSYTKSVSPRQEGRRPSYITRACG